MQVLTHIAGNYCTVLKNREHYLEARKDVRFPYQTLIEIVRNGQVYLRDLVDNRHAPERIIHYMRQELV